MERQVGWVTANPDDEVLSGDDAESEGSDEDDDADQPNARQDKRDKGDAAAAQAAAEAIKGAQSTHALASEEKGPVKSTPHELVKQIRANTKTQPLHAPSFSVGRTVRHRWQ